jgi:hypothetical protein
MPPATPRFHLAGTRREIIPYMKFKSRRVQRLEEPKPEPTPFEVVGGWAEVDGDSLPSKAEAYREGMRALAALHQQRLEERRNALGNTS